MVDHSSSKSARPLGGVIAAAVALSPAVVLAGAVMVLNPGVQFEQGLASAAATEARTFALNSAQGAAPVIAGRAYEEGSEGFWLSRAPDSGNVAHVTWKAPVSVGDRVIVNLGPNDRQIIDVVSVEEEDQLATTRIDTGVGRSARFVITGRRSSTANDLIRLTVDADGRGLTPVSGAADRAL